MGSRKILVAGAGSGIGESIFKKLQLTSGVEVIGASRRGNDLSEGIRAGRNHFCDFSEEQSIFEFCKLLKSTWNRLDAVYFAFGDGLFSTLENLDPESWKKHLFLNLTAPFLLTRELIPLLQKGSLLCYLSSTAGRQGFPESSAYCASKHGLAGFAKALREEWKNREIRISVVYAGAVDTPIWDGREGFDRKDMIPVEDVAEFLASLSDQKPSFNLDEIVLLPKKGIL